MDTDQYQMGKTKIFIKDPASVVDISLSHPAVY